MTPPATFQSVTSLELEPWIGYIRVSTWKEEKISPEIQRAAIEAWAAQTGRRIVEWIEDLDVSGRHFKRKIQRAITLVKQRTGLGIAVWKYSRFGRDDYGIRINLRALEEVGGRLESATERIDASNAIGRFSRRIQFDLAAFESERIGEAWQETHKHRLAQGVPAAGRPRFGYIWHPRRIVDPDSPTGFSTQAELYEPHPEIAPVVADLYQQYIAGTGMVALARQLNERGLKTTRGGPWAYDSLLRYMDSGFPAGQLRVRDDCGCPKGDRSHKSCGHWRYLDGAHLPIVGYGIDTDPMTIWEEYKARRSLVKRQPPRARTATYELTGLVKCSRCRSAESPKRRTDGSDADWRCSRQSDGGTCPGGTTAPNGWLLAEVVLPFLRQVAAGVDAAPGSLIPAPRREGPDPAVERARLTAESARLSDALGRLTMDYALNPQRYPADAYDRAVRQLERDRTRVLAELAQHDEEKPRATAADYQPLAAGMLEQWEAGVLSTVQKNLLLRKLVRCVWVLPRVSRYQAAARVVPAWEDEPTLVAA